MHLVSARLPLWLLVFFPLSLSGNGSLVLLNNPHGAKPTFCAGAGCDVTGEKKGSGPDESEQNVPRLPAQIERNVAGSPAQNEVYSNLKNPAFPPHAFPGTTPQPGTGELPFQIDEHHRVGIATTGHTGSANGWPSGGGVGTGVANNAANGSAGVTTAAQTRHLDQGIHRDDEPVGLSNQENGPVNKATGSVPITGPETVGAGPTPGFYDPPTVSFIPTEEILADPVGPESELNPYPTGGDRPNDVPSGNVTVTVTVPEPATLALFALGVAGLGATRRRHKDLLRRGA